MTPGRLARGGRAALFAAVCVLLAATGHVLMSGRPVGGWALGAAFAVTVAAAWGPALRERGLFAVTAGAVAVQTVLHTVFSWAPSGGDAAPHVPAVGADTVHAGHAGHGDLTPLPAPLTGLTDPHALPASFGMLAAHLLAALLSGLWLAYGERAAFRLARALPAGLLRPFVLLLRRVPAPEDRPRLRPVRAGDERAPRRLHLAHSLVSRGPPRAVAVG